MDDILGSSNDLSDEDRAQLAVLIRKRLETAQANLHYQKLFLQYLDDPTDSHRDTLDLFTKTVLEPLRKEETKLVGERVVSALNIEGLKGMLPMLLLLLKNNINIPVLLSSIGVLQGQVDDLMEFVMDFIKKDTA